MQSIERAEPAPGHARPRWKVDPLKSMSFLIHSPERVLALRLALSRVIGPTSVVLDAGCGSFGLLAIMAAKLGARRVVGVDLRPLALARALAEENGVADRVQFVEADLLDVDLPGETFDVIVAMVYMNDVERDLVQQRLVAQLVQRYGRAGIAVIPNTVRYTVTGYALGANRNDATRMIEWNTHIDNAERFTGIAFTTVRQTLVRQGVPAVAASRPWLLRTAARWWARRRGRPGVGRNALRYFDRSTMTALTRPGVFTDIRYSTPSTALGYPSEVSLPVIQAGLLQVLVWQQDLVFDDLLIRTTETLSTVQTPTSVAKGDVATIHTGNEWRGSVPVEVKRAS